MMTVPFSAASPRLLLLVCVLGLLAACDRGQKPASFRTAAIERGQVQMSISATGSLRALATVDVGSQVSGQILAVEVDFNDQVRRGQAIAQIDPANFQTRVRQAQADLASARASLAETQSALRLAEAELVRKRDLAARKLISVSERDIAEAAREQAAARVGSARAAVQQREAVLSNAELDLTYTVIRSPVDGVILLRSVEPGQTVAASFQTPVLFRIAEDLTKMQIDLSIDESDVGQVREGLPVRFQVDAFPGRSFRGEVHQIRLAATNVQNVVTYPVVVQVDNPDMSLLPGMTANAEIEIARRSEVLRVPNAALRFRPEGVEVPEATAGGGQGAWMADIETLAGELGLSGEQRAALDQALGAMRERAEQRRRAMAAAGGPGAAGGAPSGATGGGPGSAAGGEWRQRMLRMMKDSLAEFRATLDPSQAQRFDAGIDNLASARRATVWTLEAGKPTAVTVRLGVSDNSHTELLPGSLAEGAQVILSQARGG